MAFVKRYWIAGLVMLLVVIHAVIIGYVRSEASRVRIAATNEIPVGVYYVQSADHHWLTQLRVHLLVAPERRLEAKATIEQNRWMIHELIEEKLRQLDPTLMQDAVLLKVKEEIKMALDERMHEEIIEQVLVNDRLVIPATRFEYPMPGNPTEPETLYTAIQKGEEKMGTSHGLMGHDAHGEESEEHGEEEADGHGAPTDGHGKPDGDHKSDGHAAKKESKASSHGAKKASPKKGGH